MGYSESDTGIRNQADSVAGPDDDRRKYLVAEVRKTLSILVERRNRLASSGFSLRVAQCRDALVVAEDQLVQVQDEGSRPGIAQAKSRMLSAKIGVKLAEIDDRKKRRMERIDRSIKQTQSLLLRLIFGSADANKTYQLFQLDDSVHVSELLRRYG